MVFSNLQRNYKIWFLYTVRMNGSRIDLFSSRIFVWCKKEKKKCVVLLVDGNGFIDTLHEKEIRNLRICSVGMTGRIFTLQLSPSVLGWSSWLWRGLNTAEVPGSIPGLSTLLLIRHSIVASIPACHAGDRGSIPRDGDYAKFCKFLHFTFQYFIQHIPFRTYIYHTIQKVFNVTFKYNLQYIHNVSYSSWVHHTHSVYPNPS